MGVFKEFFARFRRGVEVEQAIAEATEAVKQEPLARWLLFDVVEGDGTRIYSTPFLGEALALRRAYPLRAITQRNVTISQFDAISRTR